MTPPPAKTRTVAYLRVSTDDQDLGLEDQRQKVEAYARLYDLELVAVYVDDGFSGKDMTSRQGLMAALEALETHEAQALLVAKLDRLTRSVEDLCVLLRKYFSPEAGKDLLSVVDQVDTRTASGRFFLGMMVQIGQWERETIGERTKAALAILKSQGVRLGRPPRETKAEQRQLLARLSGLQAQGRGITTIHKVLVAEGFTSSTGKPLAYTQVRRMLSRLPRA